MSMLSRLDTPVFQAENLPVINYDTYSLTVGGEVAREKHFSLTEIKKMTASLVNSRLASVSGWSVRVDWYGVKWSELLREIELKPAARYAVFKSIGNYTTTVPFKDLANPRVLLAYQVSDEQLEEDYGGPLRMVIPNLWGYKSCKWLVEIKFAPVDEGGYWEKRGYSRAGTIEPGTTFDVNTKTHRSIKGGEVLEF